MSLQHDFESYLRFELPLKLNLSRSKQVACEKAFYHFSDYAKALATQAPRDFELFFAKLKEHIEKASKWRCPRTHRIAPAMTENERGVRTVAKSERGKVIYRMYEKPKDE